jgi:hypothetical protein
MSETQTNNRLLEMLQDKTPNYHPLIAMLDMASDDKMEDQIVFNCHKEIARYIEPQLKAVEHRGSVKADFGTLRIVQSAATMEKPPNPAPLPAPGDG